MAKLLVDDATGQDFTDGRFQADGFWQRTVRLGLVAVAASVFLLDDVPGLRSGR